MPDMEAAVLETAKAATPERERGEAPVEREKT
jgi:hypothetical protein